MTIQTLDAPWDGAQRRVAPYRRPSRQSAARLVPAYVVTANDVLDGGVRYLRVAGSGCEWTEDIGAATTTGDAAERDALLAMAETSVRRNVVIAPYAIEVVCDGAGIAHRSTRERIRATGPTTRPTTRPGNGAHR